MEEEDKERIRDECLSLLQESGCDNSVIEHCSAVAELALEIIDHKTFLDTDTDTDTCTVDERLVFRGALLHDIGRAQSDGIDHGFVGGEIARRELGLEERLVRVIQRHVGAGITTEEAKAVGLPSIDFMPRTMEEKIVAHADNLIDGCQRRTSIDDTLVNLRSKLGSSHPSIKRMMALHKDVMGKRTENRDQKIEIRE